MALILEQVNEFLTEEFPQNSATVERVGDGEAVIRQKIAEQHLRPGNTVSGPTLMMVADCAVYVAIQGVIGPEPLAVTTSLNINFLNKPLPDSDIIGHATLVKIGKRLIIGEVRLYSEGQPEPVASASATYSVPPRK